MNIIKRFVRRPIRQLLKIDHLLLNYPSGQLSPRTLAAIFKAGVPTNASLDLSSNVSRNNSVPAQSTASRRTLFSPAVVPEVSNALCASVSLWQILSFHTPHR